MRPCFLLLVFLASLLGLAGAGSGHAAFPGANGKIAVGGLFTMNPDGSAHSQITMPPSGYSDWYPSWSADGQKLVFARLYAPDVETYDSSVYVANADGSGLTNVPNTGSHSLSEPSLSPDGSKIAFVSGATDLYTINSDGTGLTAITGLCTPCAGVSPAWSPDGEKIAFTGTSPSGQGDVWVVNADGTGFTNLTGTSGMMPSWSPDGTRIAFASYYRSNAWEIWVMNADGSGQQRIEINGLSPAWSPDGRKIAFIKDNDPGPLTNDKLFTMNADGSGETLIDTSYRPFGPDWQPLPVPSYAHPQSASQLNLSLVPAFRQCGTGGNPSNAKHAPPLATNSCNPPRPGSLLAAVGPTSQSSAQMTVVPGNSDPTNGNQANVSITASLTDIQSTAGGDYNPNPSGADLTAVTRLRFTDKANGYGGLPATATEYDFKVPIDCSSTPDPLVGATCSAGTTANALVPGLIQEQRQTIVQAFRVRVDDSGANGIRGDSDDRIFATQGVFVP